MAPVLCTTFSLMSPFWTGSFGGSQDLETKPVPLRRCFCYDSSEIFLCPSCSKDSFHDRGTGYPEMHNSGFDPIEALYDFNDRMHLPMDISSKVAQDCPSYTITCAFFDAVSDGLKILKAHIQLEILCGELNLEVLKMRTSGDQHRPAHFPKTFTRMWLSNVP